MELLHEPRMARKIEILSSCESELLVLTSRPLLESWPIELCRALEACAARGVGVRVLLEGNFSGIPPAAEPLRRAGAQIRSLAPRFSWLRRARPVQTELWILDRSQLLAVNERVAGTDSFPTALRMECLLGAEAAHGMAAFFEQRWSTTQHLTFSVRHKSYSFHSGHQAESAFFSCLLGAQNEVSLSLPGGRISRGVAAALHEALNQGIRVTIFTNAEGDNAPALRRLRRLSANGASVKICGRRLRSECAVVDHASIYMGSLPSSWMPLRKNLFPVFVMHDRQMGSEILEALERQVSVEIPSNRAATYSAR